MRNVDRVSAKTSPESGIKREAMANNNNEQNGFKTNN